MSKTLQNRFWKNRKVMVTGAGSGIGKEIAIQLHAAGASVYAVSLYKHELDNLVRAVGKDSNRLKTFAMDLTAPDAVASLMQYLEDDNVTIEALFNNAGTALYGSHIELNKEKVNNMLTLNIQVMSEMASEMAKHMIQRKVTGHIMNVASIASFAPVPKLAAYSGSKHYVLAFTHALSRELEPHNIYVGALCPGITRTPIIDTMGLSTESKNRGSVSYWTSKVAMPVGPVAASALRAVERKKPVTLPGINRLVPLVRIIPGKVLSGLLYQIAAKRQAA